MLGLKGIKGSLDAGADADLVIFSEEKDPLDGKSPRLEIDEVWKFGSRVYHKSEPFSPVYSPVEGADAMGVGVAGPEAMMATGSGESSESEEFIA